MRTRIHVLIVFLLLLSCRGAYAESIKVQPATPSTINDVTLIFSGEVAGPPVTIDAVVLEALGNYFKVTVSARGGYPTGYVFNYSGTVLVGKLPAGHYTADFYVRPITVVVVNGMDVEAYGTPVFASTVSFDISAFAVPALSTEMLILLFILVALIGGGYAARKTKNGFVR